MNQITIRLKPGQDIRNEIERIVKKNDIQAGCIISAVGSLDKAELRMADGTTIKSWAKPLEIVSATGTVSIRGCHIHASFADENGALIGGHLKPGCIVKTTAEVIILVFLDVKYNRMLDNETGYGELEIDNAD